MCLEENIETLGQISGLRVQNLTRDFSSMKQEFSPLDSDVESFEIYHSETFCYRK